jgi:endonuclease/exonuclease/phosphatase family metal-dependent hydrolase
MKTSSILKSFLLALLVCGIFFVSTLPLSARLSSDEKLLETGAAVAVANSPSHQSQPSPSNEIKLVSYNMRWRGGEDLRKLIKLLKEDEQIGGASIIGLQEVDRNKKRTNKTNTAKVMAEELRMNYAWAAPPPPLTKGKSIQEEETGVAILSVYPLTDVRRIVLPNEGPGGRRRAAIGATVNIGGKTLRFYSLHAETRISNQRRIEQFKAVIDDLQSQKSKVDAAVVLGDFNTLMGKDVDATHRLFSEKGFHTPFPNDESTWKTFIISLKLDWMWLKGLEAKAFGIDKQVELSDHWPLWALVKLDSN